MKLALLTGATGLLGAEVTRQLAADGVGIRALVRPASERDRLPHVPLETITWADDESGSLHPAMNGVDVVFHLGARMDVGSALRTDDDEAPYERDNVTRSGALLEAARLAGVGRFILMSSAAVYASGIPSPVAEGAPTLPTSAYGRSKLAAEELAWTERERGLGVTVVRGSVMTGPGDRHFGPLVERIMGLPVLPLPDGGRALHEVAHVSDVAALLLHAARLPDAEGRTYNAASGRPLPIREIVGRLRAERGSGPRVVGLPGPALRIGFRPTRAALVAMVPELASVLTPSVLEYFGRDFYLSTARATEELGWQPEREFGRP